MLTVKAMPGYEDLLTNEALLFVEKLADEFAQGIEEALEARKVRQVEFDAGNLPGFLEEMQEVRDGDWKTCAVPAELSDRRVEITGPVDRKMIINALNSGANVFMADFEDSNSPTYENCLAGQVNLRDAIRRTVTFHDEDKDKTYGLGPTIATLFIRPRGLHLKEKNTFYNGRKLPATLFDFGLYVYHNAQELLDRKSQPYFYLPKLEHYTEARIWDDIFTFTEKYLEIPHGTIKATVLIETLPAAFQMDEILYELRDHSVGLNCGRWDYIFSFIKTFRNHPQFVMPDRDQVTMEQHFMRAYTQLLVQTCHKRGTCAIGGMAAQIPIKDNPRANDQALRKVWKDKAREAKDGHDGTWVAHPGLVELARAAFINRTSSPNQLSVTLDNLNVAISCADLICVPKGTCTEAGLRKNISIGYKYLSAWLSGHGCVPLNNLMEDTATAEISRTQIWQWRKHDVTLDNGKTVTEAYLREVIDEEIVLGKNPAVHEIKAKQLFIDFCLSEELDDFLTLKAYEEIQ
jgi:malate synthase